MREAVDDILALRAPDPAGLSRMMTFSFAAHIGMVAAVLLVPRDWLFKERPPATMLTISLGGSVGPQTSGMSAAGARPVDKATPEPKRVEVVKTAAAAPDVMTVPVKPSKTPPPKPSETPKPPAAVTQPPTTGRQVQTGTSRAETGAKGEGTGLTMSGGGTGADMTLTDFCCPAYISEMVSAIRANWTEAQPERGQVVVKFTVQRDGRLTADTAVENHATFLLDQASIRPFVGLKLKPFPAEITSPSLTFHLTFVYR
jgi:outer membrane biosynthesis protein TonB